MVIESNDKKSGLKIRIPDYLIELIVFMFIIIAVTKTISFYAQLFFPVFTLILSIPIIVFNFYKISITKKMNLSRFHTEGKIFRFLSGRKFIYILLIVIAPFISGYSLIKMYGFSYREWIVLFIMIPVFIFVFNLLKKHFGKEIKKVYLNIYTLHWSLLITFVLIAIIFPIIIFLFTETDPGSFGSLNDAVQAQMNKYGELRSCSIAGVIASKIAFVEGITLYFLSTLTGWWLFLAVLVTVGEGFVFISILSSFSLYLLKKDELSIIYNPISASKQKHKSKRKLIMSLLILTGILLVYTITYISLDKELKTNKKLQKALNAPQEFVVDIIDNKYVSEGTIEKLENIRKKIQTEISYEIKKKADKGYDLMINNVDNYLDWYYGITAEYIRLAKLLMGQIDVYLKEKLEENIKTNEIIAEILKDIPDIVKRSKEKFDKITDELVKTNIIRIRSLDNVIINKKVSLVNLLMFDHKIVDKININNRAYLSLISGISGAIIGRIMAKNIVKHSSRVIAKILAKKTVGTFARVSAGALAGGAGGTVATPGIGTVIGGILGGIAGFFASDFVLLKIEEEINREEYKKEIIKAINESRKEFQKWNL